MLRRAFVSSCRHASSLSAQASHQHIFSFQTHINSPSKFLRVFSTNHSQDGLSLSGDFSPQGVQGELFSVDDKTVYNVNQQWWSNHVNERASPSLQGVQDAAGMPQSHRVSSFQAAQEEDNLASLFQPYQIVDLDRATSVQGLQGGITAFPGPHAPCPQGVQGEDCTQFKIWLENCYKLGDQDCIDQYQSFRAGRKTLSQIFAEQDAAIRRVVLLYRRGGHGGGLTRRGVHTSARHRSSSQQAEEKKTVTSETSTETTEPQELSQKQKLKRAVKEYGSTVIVFHVGISLMSLGFFYVLVSSGVDVASFLAWAGLGEAALKAATEAGTFVMAYAVHKVFAPARIATTLTATPLIVRHLRARGILKPPKPAKP